MTYIVNSSSTSARCFSGASLAQIARRMTPVERAVLAADIIDGKVVLQGLTAKSVAHLVGTNQSYMFAALRATPVQRAAILAGTRPLMPARALDADGDRLGGGRHRQDRRGDQTDRDRPRA